MTASSTLTDRSLYSETLLSALYGGRQRFALVVGVEGEPVSDPNGNASRAGFRLSLDGQSHRALPTYWREFDLFVSSRDLIG